ncbi:hypothetical protein LEN26_003669 [Aphanomyces euteiches]|nr:hypothetical protein AeMF1_014481 [Aphanomyces euteiches]KAH9152662.1 hypothetical protein LEN26_003669 [Aphanomyces euteiches]KAH9196818.1 hypothetical protein AeNC1_001199 [Aphanomyces euteiches]
MNRIAFLVLAASVAQGIDLRPPCDRSVLLEAPGKGLWATCASKTGLDIDSILVPSNEAKLCSVPECVYVVQKAAVLTTCDDAALFAQLCKSNATASLPVSPTTTNPSTVTTTTSPATTAATPAQTTSQPTTSLPPTDSTTTVSPESTPIPTAAAVAPTTSQAKTNGANTFAAAGIAAVAIISAIVI